MHTEENIELAVDPTIAGQSLAQAVLTAAEKISLLEQYAKDEGASLFDVEFPSAGSGVLRVFVCGAGEKPGPILLEQCSAISRRILDSEVVEQLIPGSATLEVSSPGINRKLTRAEHYLGAVAERVKLKIKHNTLGLPAIVIGKLENFSSNVLTVALEERAVKIKPGIAKKQPEPQAVVVDIPLDLVRDGRVNFKF